MTHTRGGLFGLKLVSRFGPARIQAGGQGVADPSGSVAVILTSERMIALFVSRIPSRPCFGTDGFQDTDYQLKSLILAQNERWRRG